MKKWWQEIFNETDKLAIEKAVHEAERLTDAEIVPMIVRRSGQSEEILRGLLIGALIGLIIGYSFEIFGLHYGYAPLFSLITAAIFYFSSRYTSLGRFLLSSEERRDAALTRAELEFYRHKLSQTQNRTAVLLFISAFEHQVVVLGDEAIAKAIPESTWSEICGVIVDGLKRKSFKDNMVTAIMQMGGICSNHFPAKSVNENEISNLMIVKD